ncbi:hypothetical protein [Candidatus Proelusimicrobium excrementi]|uniref:hypothetical protein n=1 Tax=Candidatus Proelusimicrobium excrementi TaxID=3416222 RepID=UPI003CA3A932|nr:hypothetical protein [Elusimicrobiaceae bacterium]
MKNILNKIGAVSKPVIFGAALGVATVAVGVGVATNLMSDGPKGASGRVLSQYSGDTASVGSSAGGYDAYSKEALEAQIAAARAEREGGTALAYLGNAGKGRFAYGENPSAYEGGVVDPMAMSNTGYEAEAGAEAAGGTPDLSSVMNQFNATAAAANAQAGKGGAAAGEEAGTEKGQLEKAGASATQVNKLNRSNRIGSSGKGGISAGASGGVRNMGSIPGAVSSDRPGQQAVPSVNMGNANAGNISGVAGAKHGRVGSLGGSNSRGGANGSGGSGQAYFTSSMGELVSAQRYSALGKSSVYGDAEKGFEQASMAFDGAGEVTEGVQINGDTPITTKAASLEREASNIKNKNNIGKGIDNITNDSNALSAAKKGIMSTVITIVSLAIVGLALVMAMGKIPAYGTLIASIVAAAFAAVIIGLGIGLISMYVNQIKHLSTSGLNDPGVWGHMRFWLPPLIGGIPFLGLIGSVAHKAGTKAALVLSKLQAAMIVGGGTTLLTGLPGFFGVN